MTDLQIKQLCAEAIGGVWDATATSNDAGSVITSLEGTTHNQFNYAPLDNAAQCADLEHWLLQRGSIYMNAQEWEFYYLKTGKFVTQKEISTIEERRRAVCETVATMLKAMQA